jgi:hypothetical protein
VAASAAVGGEAGGQHLEMPVEGGSQEQGERDDSNNPGRADTLGVDRSILVIETDRFHQGHLR